MKKIKRLGICVFYDKDGIVDKYVLFFLQELMLYLDELCIIINGKIIDKELCKLEEYTNKIIIRENKGLDAQAYKEGLLFYGWDKLKNFDEIIMCNTTCFAPIFPFDEMFKKITEKECDFWGLWRWKAPQKSKWIKGYHIPSFFYAYRNSLVKTKDFKEYWDTMPQIKTYKDAVLYHEQRQTPFFVAKGYKYEVCYDLTKYETDKEYWPITKEAKICEKEKFPFIKRRGLFIENNTIKKTHCKKIAKLIKEKTNYDLKIVKENLDRTQTITTKKIKRKKIKFALKILIYKLLNDKKKKFKYIRNYKNFISKTEYLSIFN